MNALAAQPGQELPAVEVRIDRTGTVRYAGASGDFNPIHYSDHAAASLGLDSVIAHGMWTMGAALRVVTDWCGPERVLAYGVRFTRPVRVPDDGVGSIVRFTGTVTAVHEGVATVALAAICGSDKVLGAAKAQVRLD